MPLCAAFPRTPALLCGCSGSASDWGEEGILSPALLLALLVYSLSLHLLVVVIQACTARINGPSESAHRTTPLLGSIPLVRRIASATSIYEFQDFGGAHPKAFALAEMPEARMQMRLALPPLRAQLPRGRQRFAALPKGKCKFKSKLTL